MDSISSIFHTIQKITRTAPAHARPDAAPSGLHDSRPVTDRTELPASLPNTDRAELSASRPETGKPELSVSRPDTDRAELSISRPETDKPEFSVSRPNTDEPEFHGFRPDASSGRPPLRRPSFPRLPWKRILAGAVSALCLLLLLFFGFVWYLIATAPDIDSITVSPMESATYICDAEGNYLRKLTLATSNRDIVPLEEIPDSLQKAVIAIEDERFYEHGGIDMRGILRAFVTGITSGSFSEGASTITQQLIKNNVFTEWTQEDSFADRFRRKVQEQYLALQLEDRMSKAEILENYLNTINLGSGCYGVQAASRRYFGKDVSELTLSECAVLAAIPQNPSGYNPAVYPESNRRRQLVILNYMEEQGYISHEEHRAAETDPVYDRVLKTDPSLESGNAYSWYEDALIDQVIDILTGEKGYSQDQAYRAVYSGGLRIFSAQDQALQQICDEEFSNPANFPAGTEFGIDYALSVAANNGEVTHYGSDALRTYVRKTVDPSFDLLCTSADTAQRYADAFRAAILAEGAGGPEDSDTAQDADDAQDEADTLTVLAERLSLSPQPQASLVLMEQSTGLVRAIVGGRGEKQASLTLNRASDTTRQPGSTFKLLAAYAPALDADGQTLATRYDNEPFFYEDGTPVSNWDITDYTGPTTIREAIVRSINVIAVRCITELTPALGFSYAERFGITTLHETFESGGSLSSDIIQPLALGGITQGVTNLELCGAYAAIANDGIYRTPKFFTKILDRHGEVVYEFSTAASDTAGASASDSDANGSLSSATAFGADSAVLAPTAAGSDFTSLSLAARDNTRILKDSTAFLLTDAMRGVVSDPSGTASGTIFAAGQPVAGKTGTTSSYKDIWFTGYTPYYTCSIWGGYDNNKSLPDGSIYHTYQKVLWSAVMNRVHTALPPAEFSQPDSVLAVTLCADSQLLAVDDGCPDTFTEYFAAGTEPTEACPLHEPIPETEPILIYDDILDQLLTETESESESETELPRPGGSQTESPEPDTGQQPPAGSGGPETDTAPPDTGQQPLPDPGNSETETLWPDTGQQPLPDPDAPETETLWPGTGQQLLPELDLSGTETASPRQEMPPTPQSDTNSLQDLMERLYGANAS